MWLICNPSVTHWLPICDSYVTRQWLICEKNVTHFITYMSSPPHYFLWGYLNAEVYAMKSANICKLKTQIWKAIWKIKSDMLRRVNENFVKRMQECQNYQGRWRVWGSLSCLTYSISRRVLVIGTSDLSIMVITFYTLRTPYHHSTPLAEWPHLTISNDLHWYHLSLRIRAIVRWCSKYQRGRNPDLHAEKLRRRICESRSGILKGIDGLLRDCERMKVQKHKCGFQGQKWPALRRSSQNPPFGAKGRNVSEFDVQIHMNAIGHSMEELQVNVVLVLQPGIGRSLWASGEKLLDWCHS